MAFNSNACHVEKTDMNDTSTAWKKQKYILSLILLCSITGSFFCGKNGMEQKKVLAGTPIYGGIFRMAQLTPETLDPLFVDDIYESSITNQIFDGLLTFDANLQPVPAIAREWIISTDRKTYTFSLRQGVTFHDGKEVTADDFVYSLTRIIDPSLPSVSIARNHLQAVVGVEEYCEKKSQKIRGIKALDTYTLEIVLKKPVPTFLTLLAMDNLKVVPKETIAQRGIQWFGEHPIGTGPFKFASWLRDHQIVLEANHQYFGGKPYLDSLIFEVPLNYVEDEFVENFFNGTLDMVAVPIGKIDQFKGDKAYTIIRRPELSFEFIGFNVLLPPLNNKNVRQAIAYALNRDRIVALDPESFLSPSGIIPPGMLGYSPEQKVIPYDPEKAKQLLRASGLIEENQPLKLEYWGVGSDSQKVYESDLMIMENLALIGIDVDVRYEEWLDFDRRVTEGKAQLFSMSLIADIPDAASFLYSCFHSNSATNVFQYHNAKVDSMLEDLLEELNSFGRAHMCQEIEKRILQDTPLVPLDHIVNIYAFQPYVRGMELSPYGIADIACENLWIAPDKTDPKHDIQNPNL